MPRPAKNDRNKDLIKKYDTGWSYERLGSYFGLHFTTVREIIIRWYPIYGKKDKVKV